MNTLRLAFRAALARPGFSAAVVTVLALGIGINSAMFSLVDNLIFAPLQVQQPERLVRLFRSSDGQHDRDNWSYADIRDLGERMSSISSIAGFADWTTAHLSDGTERPQRVSIAIVTSNYFHVLGTPAALGEPFAGDERTQWGALPQLVINHRLWVDRFGSDPHIIGRSVDLNGYAFTIAAVMPRGFVGANREQLTELWVPLAMTEQVLPGWDPAQIRDTRDIAWMDAVARLAPGSDVTAAQAELHVVAASLREPSVDSDDPPLDGVLVSAESASIDAYQGEGLRRLSWTLIAIVVLVLMVACTDAAGLMLVRAEERQHEIAVRMGLGATTGRIVRQLLAEASVLALAAGAGGVLVAQWLSQLLPRAIPDGLPISLDIASGVLDPRVLVFTFATAALSLLLAGVVPALRASRVAVVPALKNEARWVGVGRGQVRLRSGFVVVQLALTTVLLIGAALFGRSLMNNFAVDLGFEPAGAITTYTDLSRAGYSREEALVFQQQLVQDLEAMPGFGPAAIVLSVPVQSGGMRATIRPQLVAADGGPGEVREEGEHVDINVVSPGFFRTLGLRLEAGRDFAWNDGPDAPQVVIVNRAYVEHFWPGADDPLRFTSEGFRDRPQVIGVVGDNLQRSVREAAQPMMYVPITQFPTTRTGVLVRTARDPAAAKDIVREVVGRIDPRLPLYRLRTLEEHLGTSLGRERMFAVIMAGFSALALVLSVIGLYSVIAFTTRQRTREFGVRIAVGARAESILRSVMREALVLGLIGVSIGLLAAALMGELVQAMLFGVSVNDPTTYLLVGAGFMAVAVIASLPSALRATRIHPIQALRYE